jgi:hypothetical protein
VNRHGGSAVAQYLRQELHGLFESVHRSQVPEVYAWAKEIGGYFKRFTGGALAPWIPEFDGQPELDLEARATLAFFEVFFLMYTMECLLFITSYIGGQKPERRRRGTDMRRHRIGCNTTCS